MNINKDLQKKKKNKTRQGSIFKPLDMNVSFKDADDQLTLKIVETL